MAWAWGVLTGVRACLEALSPPFWQLSTRHMHFAPLLDELAGALAEELFVFKQHGGTTTTPSRVVDPPPAQLTPEQPRAKAEQAYTKEREEALGANGTRECFFDGCGYKGSKTLSGVMSHMKRSHKAEGVTGQSVFKGTHFYNVVNQMNMDAQRVYRADNPKPKKAAKLKGGDAVPQAAGPKQATPAATYTVRECYVRTNPDGSVARPLEVFGIVGVDDPPDGALAAVADCPPTMASPAETQRGPPTALATTPYAPPGEHTLAIRSASSGENPYAIGPASSGENALAVRGASSFVPTGAAALAVPAGDMALQGAFGMLQKMYESTLEQDRKLQRVYEATEEAERNKNWRQDVPVVNVKEFYVDLAGPKAKGEDNVRRATWPRKLAKDFVKLPEFEQYLRGKLNKGYGAKVFLLGAGRALGALEIIDAIGDEGTGKADVKVLVGLYTSGHHTKLLDTPVLQPKYYWTANVISGLAAYTQFHIRLLTTKRLQGDKGPTTEYQEVLRALVDDITTGYSDLCAKHRDLMLDEKQREDARSLKLMPSVDRLQQGVLEGYMILRKIVEQYECAASVPRLARGAANAIIAGAIHFDTYGGRIWEWEHAEYTYVCTQLDERKDFIVCQQHKTFKTYGDLAKKLTEGLFDALAWYRKLPRPEGVNTFLVPVSSTATSACMVRSLKTFCSRHLTECKLYPTTNICRKWFHRTLMQLTKDEERLKDMMVVLDAHSKKVMDRHYLLREPEDDITLANALIKEVLGTTVAFPSAEATAAYFQSNQERAALLAQLLNEQGDHDEGEEDEAELEEANEQADEPLQWWEERCGFRFGELIPLGNVDDEIDSAAPSQRDEAKDAGLVKKEAIRKKSKIPEEKRKLYEEYYIKTFDGTRTYIDDSANDWMRAELRQWQQANNKGPEEVPFSTEWYLDKRIEAIKAGHLTKHHCEDAVRNVLTKKGAKQKKKAVPKGAASSDAAPLQDVDATQEAHDVD